MTAVEEVLTRPETGTNGSADQAAVRTPRPYRSWAVVVVGGVLVTVTGLAAAEVISALAGSPVSLLPVGQAGDTPAARWSDPAVHVASAVLVLISLLMIALALLPGWGRGDVGHPHDLTFAAGVSRGALRRILTTAACEVDGVREARVSVFGQRVKVRAAAEAHRIAEVTAEVHNAMERKIGELSLLKEPKIRVAVRCVKT